jgi:hypothetical protein
MFDTKKGKYSEEENERIITALNEELAKGRPEREVIRELANELNRGYAGIIAHVRKLRAERPERFTAVSAGNTKPRLNSWSDEEEEILVQTVNQFAKEGKPITAAIEVLKEKLSRTPGAIYQRIYTLRNKYPHKFTHLPKQRPRRRKQPSWAVQKPVIRKLETPPNWEEEQRWNSEPGREEASATAEAAISEETVAIAPMNSEEAMLLKAFEERYGRINHQTKEKMLQLMRRYGCTRVSIALFTLSEDKDFPMVIANFLEEHLKKRTNGYDGKGHGH